MGPIIFLSCYLCSCPSGLRVSLCAPLLPTHLFYVSDHTVIITCIFLIYHITYRGFLGGPVKNLPAIQETPVQSLGWQTPWRRGWQPTLVFLPGESPGQRSLVDYSPWYHKKLATTEQLTHTIHSLRTKSITILDLIAQWFFFLQYVKSCLWDKRTKVNSDYKIKRTFQEHIWENLGIT